MKREQLEVLLKKQYEQLIEVKNLDEEELVEIQDKIGQMVDTQAKINALKTYVDSYKDEIRDYLEANGLQEVYAPKGRAVYRVADTTTIKKDLVLAVIDEFRCGERDTISYEDVTETKTMKSFTVRPIKIKEEM